MGLATDSSLAFGRRLLAAADRDYDYGGLKMLGLDGRLLGMTRARVLHLAVAVAIVMSALALAALHPSSAHASECDSWTNTAGGNWFTAGNWSKGTVPVAGEDVCITAEGTYTVTMTQTNTTSTVNVNSLTLGGASGTQTLAVGSSCSLNAILTTTAGISNGAHGAIMLTNGEGCGTNVTLVSSVNNAGSLASEPANGGTRQIQGSLTNTGTLAINTNTSYNGASAVLSNQGSIDLAEAKQLAVSSAGSVSNETGGSISATGSGNLSLGSGTSFTEGAGTTSGTKPVIVDDGTLSYTGSGSSAIALRGTSSLSGTSVAGQSLSIESTCSENVIATAASGFSNGGTMTLTNGEGCGTNVTVVVSSGTLTNSGKIVTELAHGGTRSLQGNLTNTGTLAINTNTAYNGASAALTNEGPLNLAEGTQLTVSNGGSVANRTGGKISATGSADLFMGNGTSFTEAAGITTGTKPVIVDDGALIYTPGAGKSLIATRGTSTLSGNLAAVQSLIIESTCGENSTETAASSFSNAGTITLTNGDGCADNATLAITEGALANTGKLVVEPAIGGARFLQGNITNTGTLAIKANTTYNTKNALLTNEGALNLAEGTQLNVSSGGSVTNGAGGSISSTGTSAVFITAGTFTEGAGTTIGTKPVIVDDGTLSYTGSGKSQIALRGSNTLNGNLGSEQSLSIESTCGENATATSATGFANAGTITLTNFDGCADNATLAVTEGAVTNSGKIITQPAIGGARSLQGNITNTGTLSINASTVDSVSGAILQNGGTISIAAGTTFSFTAPTVTNAAGGTIFGAGGGALVQTKGTFNEAAGITSGPNPVILDDATLNYTEHGSGPIQLRGVSNLSGAVRAGETLVIASTCSENAVVSAAGSFNANGTLELTNGDGCGNNATLNLKGGTLTNNGTLNVGNVAGGARTIEGNLTNNLILGIVAGQTLHVTGSYTQSSAGRLKTFIASSGSFGVLSVAGPATIAGSLTLRQGAFKASLGQTYPILTSSSLTGAFATESEAQVNFTGLYYKPTYSATGATLVVTQATQVRSPKSGPAGTLVTISGSGYVAGDTITPTFTDHGALKTAYSSVTTSSGGEFSAEITIPPGAATGAGEIVVTSAQTGVHVGQTFTVTP
jgi:hypothetical protein